MRLPEFITFTGLDVYTDLRRVSEICNNWPLKVEWGVLRSSTRQGREPRYPRKELFLELAELKQDENGDRLLLSQHVCGSLARAIADGQDPSIHFSMFERVQVNGPIQARSSIRKESIEVPLINIRGYAAKYQVTPIIQWRTMDFPGPGLPLCLFDTSGGTGHDPKYWPEPVTHMVGYAGGINPDNVLEKIEQINAGGPYWIDMESGVRNENDWLDLDKCEDILAKVYGG